MKKFVVIICLLFMVFSFNMAFALDKVNVMMDWLPTEPGYYPFIAGIEKGYFKEEGIEINIIQGKGALLSAQALAAGRTDFVSLAAATVVVARSQGVPIKTVFQMVSKNSAAMFCRKDRNVKKIEDFVGKKILYQPASSRGVMLIGFLKTNNLHDKVVLLSSGVVDYADTNMLINGTIDCMSGSYYRTPYRIDGKVEYNSFDMYDYGIKIPFTAIATSDSFIKKNPDLVKRFNKALLKSALYSKNNVDEITNYYHKRYPEVDVAELKDGYIRLITNMNLEKSHGKVDPIDYKNTYIFLKNTGQLKHDIDVKETYTNEFIK